MCAKYRMCAMMYAIGMENPDTRNTVSVSENYERTIDSQDPTSLSGTLSRMCYYCVPSSHVDYSPPHSIAFSTLSEYMLRITMCA